MGLGLLSAPRALFLGAFYALNGRSEGARAPGARGLLGSLMGALNNNCQNILTTWSTECPTTLSAASIGAAALAAGAPAVRREGPARRWLWQQRWPSSWRLSSSILLNHLPRLQDIFGKEIYLAKLADVNRSA